MKIHEVGVLLKEWLKERDYILSAKIYGSWLYDESSTDLDIAVVVRSHDGVVDSQVYSLLLGLREDLYRYLRVDVDLIPHTEDEFEDFRSVLWYPRYNPSLVFGKTIKGKFSLGQCSKRRTKFGFDDLTAYVLYDNRTICRRQLVRSLDGEQGRIFVSKLLHGPGNALTYHHCRNGSSYICSPSDQSQCFDLFDEVYGVNSLPALQFLKECRKEIDFLRGLKLMLWYESLVALVLRGQSFSSIYQDICSSLQGRTAGKGVQAA